MNPMRDRSFNRTCRGKMPQFTRRVAAPPAERRRIKTLRIGIAFANSAHMGRSAPAILVFERGVPTSDERMFAALTNAKGRADLAAIHLHPESPGG
jgi:hypothetical protein